MRKEGVEIETKTSQLNETRTKQKNQAHRSSERTSAFLKKPKRISWASPTTTASKSPISKLNYPNFYY